MRTKEKELKSLDIMENAHLLQRYRNELGWTIEKTAQKAEISLSKFRNYVLQGQLKVSELERICRIWHIPITSFFSQDLLPEGIEQPDIKKISDNASQVSEPTAEYQKTDALLQEKESTISLLKEQLERSQKNEEFLQGLINKLK